MTPIECSMACRCSARDWPKVAGQTGVLIADHGKVAAAAKLGLMQPIPVIVGARLERGTNQYDCRKRLLTSRSLLFGPDYWSDRQMMPPMDTPIKQPGVDQSMEPTEPGIEQHERSDDQYRCTGARAITHPPCRHREHRMGRR
jgi:hypothetical protein